jgi:hypothetical protein
LRYWKTILQASAAQSHARSNLFFLLCMYAGAVAAQHLPTIAFHGPPNFEQGVPVEPYALFYADPTGDTLQLPASILRQPL